MGKSFWNLYCNNLGVINIKYVHFNIKIPLFISRLIIKAIELEILKHVKKFKIF